MDIKKQLWVAIIGAALSATAVTGQTPAPSNAQTTPQKPAASGEMPKTKVAILSFFALRDGIEELKQKYQKLQAEFAPRATTLESLQNSIESKEKVLAENKNLTPQQARKLAEEIDGLKREFERSREDAQDMARKREQEETGPVLEKISDFLEKYCQRHGITHVFDLGQLQETNAALYAAPTANITEDFIKEYNKSNPASAAPAAGQPKKP